MKSMLATGSSKDLPAGIVPGQLTAPGTRIPPS